MNQNNQDLLDSIANKHLGTAGDGSRVKPYVTPDSIDKTLLVPIPRYLNRTDYGIDDNNLPFQGFDTWNAYEVSALTNNGYPVTGVAKIVYSSDSRCIVESKSLKLYLNSYNMQKMGRTVDDVCASIEDSISADLSEALETMVEVRFFSYKDTTHVTPVTSGYTALEYVAKVEDLVFNRYNEDPSTLMFDRDTTGFKSVQRWTTNALRSNCRVTNQPDWGDLYIYINSTVGVTPESLLQYVVSMRKENHFHEEIVECVYKRLYDALPKGSSIGVMALYTRRGGIDINPCRYSDESVAGEFADLRNVDIRHCKTDKQ